MVAGAAVALAAMAGRYVVLKLSSLTLMSADLISYCQNVESSVVNVLFEDEVLISGIGHKGHDVGDIPGVKFKVFKVSGVSLWVLLKEKKEKSRS
ncbi:unnamed protein product [Eruca vesicaria subsp. sativa]|uniref:S12 n=1 Tax=Eruca vesicaria subsp. sativa TaxID=29727 RepID=A0ABC8IYH3_ERUVS|nr:unnamed protein product [Eruca vesicaria subsp. sativa]